MTSSFIRIVSEIDGFNPGSDGLALHLLKEKSPRDPLVNALALNGLGENWWMQIIDGRDHVHGHAVYDKGLHGHGAEKGYYAGILAGHICVLEHVHDPLTV